MSKDELNTLEQIAQRTHHPRAEALAEGGAGVTGPAWLSALQVGDKVIERVWTYGATEERVCEVERLTRTQIVLVGAARRYRRTDGGAVGDTEARLREATPEAVAGISASEERRALTSEIRALVYRWSVMTGAPLESLRRVVAILRGESGGGS